MIKKIIEQFNYSIGFLNVENLAFTNYSKTRKMWYNAGFEINAWPRQAEIPSSKLFFDLICPTGKLTKYSVLRQPRLFRDATEVRICCNKM